MHLSIIIIFSEIFVFSVYKFTSFIKRLFEHPFFLFWMFFISSAYITVQAETSNILNGNNDKSEYFSLVPTLRTNEVSFSPLDNI